MINYLPASGGGGTPLTYPIVQDTIDLSTADFTKLNSIPVQILPGLTTLISPLNITIQYTNTTAGFFGQFFIGFESQLGASAGFNALMGADFTIAGATISGIWTESARFEFPPNYPSNTTNNEALVIWNTTDDPLFIFSKFIVTITYMRIAVL